MIVHLMPRLLGITKVGLAMTLVAIVMLAAFAFAFVYIIRSTPNETTSCTPTKGYISTTTLSVQNTTTTEEVVYDGTPCNFGDAFNAPSAILIPANTLTWTNFQLHQNANYFVSASIAFLADPEAVGANVTVAFYLKGRLNSTTVSQVGLLPNMINASNASIISIPGSSSSTANSVIALNDSSTPTVGVGGQTGWAVSLGDTIAVAFVSNKPLWLLGWTPADMSKGSGPGYGRSFGQLKNTYEWTDSGLSLPNTLPQATTTTTTLQFELRISGSYFP